VEVRSALRVRERPWALGERILTPQIPGNDQGSIEEAYEFLTGIGTPKP
jgi:hypothetical protein